MRKRAVQSLVYTANITCHRPWDYDAEIESLKNGLLSSACIFSFVNSALHKVLGPRIWEGVL
jgi:hypothetical protein